MKDTYNRRFFFILTLLIIFLTAVYFAIKLSYQVAGPASELAAIKPTAPLVERTAGTAVLQTSEQVKIIPKLMINIATASEIAEQLKGIGNKTARLIVEYRQTYGPFESFQDLEAVKGIGMAKIEANREIISFALEE